MEKGAQNLFFPSLELPFWYWGLILGPQACLTFEPLHQSFFVLGIFEIGSQTVCPGWAQTAILLIAASQVARITDMYHWPLACILFLRWGLANFAQAILEFLLPSPSEYLG
jgi:hypothetical protein